MTLRERADAAAKELTPAVYHEDHDEPGPECYACRSIREIADAIGRVAKEFAADACERLFIKMAAGVPAGAYDGEDNVGEALTEAERGE